VKDLIGYFSNGRVDGAKVTADFHYLESVKNMIVPIAQDMADKVGLSVWCHGPSRLDRSTREEIVENVVSLQCVDLVSTPGSTVGLFESLHDPYRTEEDVAAVELAEAFDVKPERASVNSTEEDKELLKAVGDNNEL
jgi:hypothetical protein